jgi:hypothetical protein
MASIIFSAVRGSQVKTSSFFGRATVALWRRALPRGIVVGVPSRWRFVWAAGCALGSCCRGGAEGPWVLEVLTLEPSRKACGDLGEGWAE